MKTMQLIAGTPDWHAHRATHFNASDAPAMLGCSPYMTRAELMRRLHTGVAADVDPATQQRFDDGHRFEALARPLAEEIIGEDLAPVVGTEGELSASFDGLTLMGDIAFEHKTLNDELRAVLSGDFDPDTVGDLLPKHYRVQMEQQLMVSGAQRVLFMASKWEGETLIEEHHCWYDPNPALRAEIIAGWKQFAADLAAYKPPEVVAPVTAAPVESLPAVSVRMDGALTVASNLPEFGKALRAFVERIPARPTTDQEFADTDAACKALKKAEEALQQAEDGALASMTSVEELRRVIGDLRTLARTTRLEREKMVERRKLEIRTEEVQRGKDALAEHIAGLNATIGKPYMPASASAVDFGLAIKGLRSLDSVRATIDQKLADAKIAANAIAGVIMVNMRYLRENAKDYASLFPDTATIVLKASDDLQALVTSRIAEHKAAEEKRLETERERIRAEEAAKLQREQEAQARQASEAAKPAPTPAPTPAPAPASLQTAANVVPMRQPVQAAPSGPPTLSLTKLATRLGFHLTAAFLAEIGIEQADKERTSVLYHESDFPRIKAALIAHIDSLPDREQMAA